MLFCCFAILFCWVGSSCFGYMYGNFDNKEMRELSSISLSFGGSLTCKIGIAFWCFHWETNTKRRHACVKEWWKNKFYYAIIRESQKTFQEAMNIRMTNLELRWQKMTYLSSGKKIHHSYESMKSSRIDDASGANAWKIVLFVQVAWMKLCINQEQLTSSWCL